MARHYARDHSGDQITGDVLLFAIVEDDSQLREELAAGGLDPAALHQVVVGPTIDPVKIEEPLDLSPSFESRINERILDANANRAGEALRVLEDYARFGLEDAGLSRALKTVRHDLAELLADLLPRRLAARDTAGDVGTQISTPAENRRGNLFDVVVANSRRLQESLRCLEEYGKVRGGEFGSKFETLRYETYVLERSLEAVIDAQARLKDVRLYLLLSGATCRTMLDWAVAEATAGGVGMVQLREKSLSDEKLLTRARKMRQWTKKADVLFIVNDRPDIARLAGADGVHLGQHDLSVRDARAIVGSNAIIGVSTHDIEQVRKAVRDGATYIGVGPTFPSSTKEFAEYPGLDFVRAAVAETALPTFVLGGVKEDNVAQVAAAGGRRVAVSAAIAGSDDPRQAALRIAAQLS